MKKAALLFAVLILCLTLSGCVITFQNSLESLTRWVERHREPWEKIVSAQRDGSIRYDRELTDQWGKLFWSGELEYVSYNQGNGDYKLYFNEVMGPPEGERYLIWSVRSMEEIAPLIPGEEANLQEKTDSRMYWTGLGIGYGYMIVERIFDNWYYIEYNRPT